MNYYFTSITANYLAKARVLGKSLKKHNPNAKFILVMSDEMPSFVNLDNEPFDDVLFINDFDEIKNKEQFLFKHTITELCTAVKAMAPLKIMKKYNASSVIYLDPDIAVFDSLDELERQFNDNSILLVPHQTHPEQEDFFIKRNEILFLKRGSYNFGFFGVKNDEEGNKFLNWWNARLCDYCFDDNYDLLPELSKDGLLGMFTDQKWADLIPSFFENVKIIKEPGYNVCTWNLTQRVLKIRDAKVTVDEKPLYFFHFSGYDSGAHRNELENILRYDDRNKDVRQLSEWYGKQLKENEEKRFAEIEFNKNSYSNGEKINDFERKLFHIRKDIYELAAFQDPFYVSEGECFYKWVRQEYKEYFDKNEELQKQKELIVQKRRVIDKIFPINTKRRIYAKRVYRFFVK